MKYSTTYISIVVVVIVVLVAIIVSAASKSSQTQGYSGAAHYGSYENFMPLSYSTYPGNQSTDQKVNNDITPSKAPYQPVRGFRGSLFGPPDATGNSANLDMYSTAPGSLSLQCLNTSSGYSNSKGYLCMNPQQLKMLQTRGGNQTGAPAQIGGGCNV